MKPCVRDQSPATKERAAFRLEKHHKDTNTINPNGTPESRGSEDRIWDMLVAPTPRHPQTHKPHLWLSKAKFLCTSLEREFLLVRLPPVHHVSAHRRHCLVLWCEDFNQNHSPSLSLSLLGGVVMASLALCLPPRLCVHHLHWKSPQGGLLRRHQGDTKSAARVAKQGSIVSSPSLLRWRVQEGTRTRCSASASGDAAPPDTPLLPEATNGSARSTRWKSQVWVAIGVIGIVALGLAGFGILRRNHLMSNTQREASQLIADISTSSSSSQAAEQFTVNWFGRKFTLSARSPGYMYFLLLMAAGFGLFVSEEALNVWVGGTLGRLLIWNQSRDTFMSSLSANLPYIASTIIWVYWGVCISDMVPFYAGRQAAKSGTGSLIREKLGVSQEKFDQVKANVQRYGNLIGIVERLSLGIRNPTSFIAGFVGINPTNYFAGVCVGALITLPLQMGVGVVLRDRPVAALAGVAAVVGVWTLLPYIAAGIGSIMYIARRRGRGQSSEPVE